MLVSEHFYDKNVREFLLSGKFMQQSSVYETSCCNSDAHIEPLSTLLLWANLDGDGGYNLLL